MLCLTKNDIIHLCKAGFDKLPIEYLFIASYYRQLAAYRKSKNAHWYRESSQKINCLSLIAAEYMFCEKDKVMSKARMYL